MAREQQQCIVRTHQNNNKVFCNGSSGSQLTHLSSTSWNTQFGVWVVVKMRLSVGILGAAESEEET